MSIKDWGEKIKPFYFIFLIAVIGSIFVALWKISQIEQVQTPIRITNGMATSTGAVLGVTGSIGESQVAEARLPAPKRSDGGQVIGSKTGKKYYFPWCGTVARIKPENQVHFASAEEARANGFTPGGNCKGLK